MNLGKRCLCLVFTLPFTCLSFKEQKNYSVTPSQAIDVAHTLYRIPKIFDTRLDSVNIYLTGIKNQIKTREQEGYWNYYKGNYCHEIDDNRDAVIYLKKALRIFSVLEKTPIIQNIYANLGDIALEQNDVYSALIHYMENYDYLLQMKREEKLKETNLLAEVCNKLGTLLKQINQLDNAKRFFLESYDFAKGESYIKTFSLFEYCKIQCETGEGKTAYKTLTQYKKSHKSMSLVIEKQFYKVYALACTNAGDYAEAHRAYSRLLSFGRFPFTEAESMEIATDIAVLYFFENKPLEAIEYCNQVVAALETTKNLASEKKINEVLYYIYFKQRQFDKAHFHFTAYENAVHAIKEKEIAETIQFWDSKAEYDRRLYKDSLLFRQGVLKQKNQLELHKKEMSFRNKELLFLFVALVFALFFIVSILLILRRIKIKNAQLGTSLVEKEVLLKEVHHRVKNNFQIISSLLNLQSNLLNDEKSIVPLKEAQSRIYSMSLVHQKIYISESLESVDMHSYLKDLTDTLASTLLEDKDRLESSITCKEVYFSLEKAVPIGLIANELISNAFKYVHPTGDEVIRLSLSLYQKDNLYHLEIQDNGKGFPEGINFDELQTLGIELVRILTGQLNGTWVIENRNGAYICITFP